MSHVDGADDGIGYGVSGKSNSGKGVYGHSDNGCGMYGDVDSGFGVQGKSDGGYGIYGQSNGGEGVVGQSVSGNGVIGKSTSGSGLHGESDSSYGVYGSSTSSDGIHGYSDSGPGMQAHSNSNYGVLADSNTSDGVYGNSSSRNGVYGTGVKAGVYGVGGDDGVYGMSDTGNGIHGKSTGGHAGYFDGNVTITGSLSKGGGSFKIDHPLDPANKYLCHSFVESPDMKNIYDGIVALDDKGEAVIDLPDWFGALNKDFRYQLTAIGAPAPNLYIAEEIISDTTASIEYDIQGIRSGKRCVRYESLMASNWYT